MKDFKLAFFDYLETAFWIFMSASVATAAYRLVDGVIDWWVL